MNSGLITNLKSNQLNNNKMNIASNQINNFNKPQSKTKNNSFLQMLLKFKTQKSSPHKTPPKSMNKICVEKNKKNTNINLNLNQNMSKAKLINKEIDNIITNINNNNSKILMNYNSNHTTENNKNSVYYNKKNSYNKSTKDSPRNLQYNKKNNINNRDLNSTISIINKNAIRDKVIIKDDQNNNNTNINRNPLNLKNININQFQAGKNKKLFYQKNLEKVKNINYRNTNIISNYHSNTNTNIDTNIYHINNKNNTNISINSMVNYSNNNNNPNNIQYIYNNPNANKKQIFLQQNKNITQQRTIFSKNCHKENKYKNINLTNPVTVNNSKKTSVEKKLKNNTDNNALNLNINNNHSKKNTILNITNNNRSQNKYINNNINNHIKQNLSINNSKERITYTNNNNNSQNPIISKNNNYIDSSYNSIINHNKINHTTVNSPNRNKVPSIQIKIKNCKEKVYLRAGGNHNLNNLNIKIPHITTVNSKDLSNYINYNKSPEINLTTNNNKITKNINLNLNNNFSFNYSSKQKNKNKKQKNNNNNTTCKTISHKHSFNNLINENDITNQNNNTEINGNNIISASNSKKLNIKKEKNIINNKSSNNYFQLSNNTSTNINNHKKTPKIIDIKKCIIMNNRNNKSKNKLDRNNNYNLINNKRGQSLSNKQKDFNITNNRLNLRINNPSNYCINGRSKKMTKNNTVLNSNSINHNSNFIEYTDIIDDEKILKRNYSNIGHNKKIKSISNSKSKSLSKSKIKKNFNKNEIHGLIEDIRKIKKKKIAITTNITANQSYKNSFNQSKNNLSKKVKTLTVTVTNSNNNSTLKNNTNTNNSIILFESESKERKKILIKQGAYYLKECERLSKYIKEYFLLNDNYPNSQVSFYKYGRLIGRGAFGKVNLGLHILTGRIVAIKSFNKNNLKNERAKSKIYHEINLMKNLRHSSVVKLLDTFETKNYILIIMENISGGDLLSFVKKRTKLNEKICKFIFKQLLQAIKFIHTKNIIHRDIKLDNVLIDLNNNIKLCDFGVGKMVHEGEILTDQCGTPAYIAPEILENKGYEGPPVDIWSSGVVLYAMLSGTVPFRANNLNDLQNMIMTGTFKEINDISKESNDLLHKLLQVNPKKRITIDEALSHPWLNNININNVGVNNNNIFEDNKLSLFTKAEMVLLSKNNIDYRNCTKEEMIENFTIKNLDTKNITQNKNNLTKSFIFAPFNSSYVNEELKKTHLEENLSVENNIILFDETINILNRQYELNNNGEIDHGVLINRSNMTSRTNNTNNNENLKKNVSKEKNVDEQKAQQISEEGDKSKKVLSCSNSKKSINISKEKELNVPNRNKGNYLNSMLTYSSTAIIDENILKNMENYGYKKEYIQKCISNNEVNYCSATYYLLCNSSEIIA